MVFWTWAKGLEDEFDGANRHSLRQFISMVVPTKPTSPHPNRSVPLGGVEFIENYLAAALADCAPTDRQQSENETIQLVLDTGGREKIPLPRMSTMAIFHKLSYGKGVPHTFYGFLKQWPALPQVVVSLFINIQVVRVD
jgi:KUP system potassium uptake protein